MWPEWAQFQLVYLKIDMSFYKQQKNKWLSSTTIKLMDAYFEPSIPSISIKKLSITGIFSFNLHSFYFQVMHIYHVLYLKWIIINYHNYVMASIIFTIFRSSLMLSLKFKQFLILLPWDHRYFLLATVLLFVEITSSEVSWSL